MFPAKLNTCSEGILIAIPGIGVHRIYAELEPSGNILFRKRPPFGVTQPNEVHHDLSKFIAVPEVFCAPWPPTLRIVMALAALAARAVTPRGVRETR